MKFILSVLCDVERCELGVSIFEKSQEPWCKLCGDDDGSWMMHGGDEWDQASFKIFSLL